MYQPQRTLTTTLDILASELEMTKFRAGNKCRLLLHSCVTAVLLLYLWHARSETQHTHMASCLHFEARHTQQHKIVKVYSSEEPPNETKEKEHEQPQRGPPPPPRNQRPIIARKLTTKLETACSFPPASPALQVHASRSTSAPTPSSPPSRQIRRYRPTLL